MSVFTTFAPSTFTLAADFSISPLGQDSWSGTKAERTERQERLTAGLEKLPEAQRDLLRQRYADGLSLEAIADSVRRTVNAVAPTLFRARRTLIDCVTRLAGGAR